MFRLIKFLFTGDWHLCKYEEVDKTTMTTTFRITGVDREHDRYTMRCACCGAMKTFDTDS